MDNNQVIFNDEKIGFFIWTLPDDLMEFWNKRPPESQKACLEYMQGKIIQMTTALKVTVIDPKDSVELGKIIDRHMDEILKEFKKYWKNHPLQ